MKKTFLTLALPALLSIYGSAAAHANDSFADVQFSPGSILFSPGVPYTRLELTIAGNGVFWQRSYDGGGGAAFSTSDAALADGHYRYELVASQQDTGDHGGIEVSEEADEGSAYRQWGQFEVVQGEIVAPPEQSDDSDLPG